MESLDPDRISRLESLLADLKVLTLHWNGKSNS